jgi:N-acetylmuramoyl-L-alanine amidase
VKVYLAVGHGRRPNGTYDPGATAGKATEQNQGDPIVQAAAKRLRDLGVTVRAQRAGDANFVGYTREANEWGADLAVSVHHDWSGAPRGAFGFWYPGSAQGKRLADAIYKAVEAAGFPMRPSWHKSHSRLYFLNNTRMPAVLWECDRVGQVTDHAKYGRALADGIARYLGIALNPKPAPVLPEGDDMRLVHLDKRGGIAYEYRNDTRTLVPVPSREFAEALTGDPDWHRDTVVIKSSDLGSLGVRVVG